MSFGKRFFGKGLWLGALCCTACGAQPPRAGTERSRAARGADSAILASFSAHCSGSESLAEELSSQAALLQQTSRKLDLDLSWIGAAEVPAALRRQRAGFLLYVYSGHGKVEYGRSAGCYPPKAGDSGRLVFDDLARQLPTGLKGATFVINACESAYVDPRGPVPISVISASPFAVATDSLFGHFLPQALEYAATDPNCDGLVTDRELFEALSALLAQAPALSIRPAFPKLRRNADSDIPLPIKPLPVAACEAERTRVARLIRANAGRWGPLGAGLLRQLALAQDPEQELPSSTADYFFVTGTAESKVRAGISEKAQAARLQPLPDDARAHAQDLARFAIFTDIYQLDVSCGFVRLIDVRSGGLLATKPPEELASAIPRRVSLQSPALPTLGPLRRVIGKIPSEAPGQPVPCYGSFGQCFAVANEQ